MGPMFKRILFAYGGTGNLYDLSQIQRRRLVFPHSVDFCPDRNVVPRTICIASEPKRFTSL